MLRNVEQHPQCAAAALHLSGLKFSATWHSTRIELIMMQAARQTMLEMQSVLRTVDQELPDTATAVRLSGLELSDAIEEVSLLR